MINQSSAVCIYFLIPTHCVYNTISQSNIIVYIAWCHRYISPSSANKIENNMWVQMDVVLPVHTPNSTEIISQNSINI